MHDIHYRHIAAITLITLFHVLTLGFFIPWHVSHHRHLPHTGVVILLNLIALVTIGAFGLGLIPWLAALIMSVRSAPRPASVTQPPPPERIAA